MNDRLRELEWNVVGYAAVAVAALVALAILVLAVPAVRRRWWPIPHLRPGPWQGHEVFLAFCTMLGFPNLMVLLLIQIGFFAPLIGPMPDLKGPGKELAIYGLRCELISSPLGVAVTLAVLFTILFARSRCRPHHLGLSWARWPANLGLGLLAFLVVTPLVLGLHALTTLVFGDQPHPLAELNQVTLYDWEWFFVGFTALVGAPLIEEIIFRGVLLGWLWRANLTGHLAIATATLLIAALRGIHEDPTTHEFAFNGMPLIFAAILTGGYVFFLIRLTRRFGLEESEIQNWRPEPTRTPLEASSTWSKADAQLQDDERLRMWRDANAPLALYGSSMLFALFHAGAWPAPIALFPFALAIGYLAQRSQSLIGPIALHATFNAVAFIALYGSTHYELGLNGNEETNAARPSLVGSITSSMPASQLPLRK